jgi:nicotinamidase-related amidase
MTSASYSTHPRGAFNTAATDKRAVQPAARLPALLLIDIQKKFCDPDLHRGNDETVRVSYRIMSATREFRQAGLPFYPIYFTRSRQEPLRKIDFYGFVPTPDDTIFQKNTDSAFDSTSIGPTLKRDGYTDLLVCGFNLNACVRDTILDAASNGFKVALLRDLTGNDNHNNPAESEKTLATLTKAGVIITSSQTALTRLRTGRPVIAV